jgi:hypothetical protein
MKTAHGDVIQGRLQGMLRATGPVLTMACNRAPGA